MGRSIYILSRTGNSQTQQQYFRGNGNSGGRNNQNANSGDGRTANQRERSSRQPICFRCQEVGHIARYCPSSVGGGGMNNVEQGNIVDSFQNLSVDDVAFIASEDAAFTAAGDSTGTDSNALGNWYIDSAATRHMTFERESFIDFYPLDEPKGVALGDNAVITVTGTGTVSIPIYDNRNSKAIQVTLKNVLFVPKLKKNLISVPTITDSNAEVLFDNEKCVVRREGKFHINFGQKVEGSRLYRANTKLEYANIVESSAELWHYRMGHIKTTSTNL